MSKMHRKTFCGYFFWPVGILYFIAAIAMIITTAVIIGNNSDKQSYARFQYDFFNALSGAEGLKYGNDKAYKIAQIFRNIPSERLEEDFSDITLLSKSEDPPLMAEQLIIGNRSKQDRIYLYLDLFIADSDINSSYFLRTFRDDEKKKIILNVLNGEQDPPQIQNVEMSVQPRWEIVIPLIFLIAQFVAYIFYVLLALDTTDEYGNRYNAVTDIPHGIWPKISHIFVLPGALPIMLICAIWHIVRYSSKTRSQRREKRKNFSFTPTTLGSTSTQESLHNLRARMEERSS